MTTPASELWPEKLLQDYMLLVSAQRWDEWIDLWAEDGVLEFPYAPPGRRSSYAGKADILAYMKPTAGRLDIDTLEYFDVHPMLDPTTCCFEMAVKGRIAATGVPFQQKYISIVETRDGKISRYREYWNPVVSIAANGSLEAWAAAFGNPMSDEVVA